MSDSRFAALAHDPRYRIPNRKKSRTAVDKRFKGLFSDQNFQKNASVDRYGRKIKSEAGKKDLESRFTLTEDDEDDEEEDEEEEEELSKASRLGKSKAKGKGREVVGSSEESDSEEEEEDGEEAAVAVRRDPARDGGFSESSSDEESSDEELSEAEAELAEETAGPDEEEEIPMGEVSRRIAAVNLDWDNIRATDIMAVAASFVPKGGRVERVTIYPSEFGKERLQREELEGPPREIFASGSKKPAAAVEDEDVDSDEEDEKIKQKLLKEQAGDSEEFDTAKLRQYQLERLRYYYAVVECDSPTTAKALYDDMDGREYLSTANFFDLRFIPDEVSFDDDKPHEECDALPAGYRPNEFKTEALTHSKVRLTWDDDDATRKEVQRRAFSRAEMEEEDLKAYIGSDSSDAESTTSRKSSAADSKAKKREAQREKMRAALGLPAETTKAASKDKSEPVGEMQITFTSGLSGNKGSRGVFENEPQDEESTRARYIRKERERKQRRKEKLKAKNGEAAEEEAGDAEGKDSDDEVADPFDDPFFHDPAAASRAEAEAKKAEKRKKREAAEAREQEAEARKAELDLLMAEDQQDNLRHFNMNEIKKAEKAAKRKGKKGKKKGEEAVVDDFHVETEDPRFKKLFESHEFAIDPSNKLYADTKGMRETVAEGRKKRKAGLGLEDGEREERTEKPQGKKARRARV